MHFIIFAPLLFKEHDPEAEWALPLNGPWINCSSDWCKEIGFSHLFWISTFKKYFYFKKKSLEKCAEFTFFHYNVQQWSRSVFKCNNKYNKNRHFGVLTVTWIENLSFMFFFFFSFVDLYIIFGCFDGPVQLHKNQRLSFEKDSTSHTNMLLETWKYVTWDTTANSLLIP